MNGGREGIVHEDSHVLNNFCDPVIHDDSPFCIALAEKREDTFKDLAYDRPQHPSSEGANTTDHTSAVPVAWTSVRSIKAMTRLGMGQNSSENFYHISEGHFPTQRVLHNRVLTEGRSSEAFSAENAAVVFPSLNGLVRT